MEISITVFKSVFDNKTHRRMDFSSFNEFEKFLYDLSKVHKKGKKDAQLISPATYEPDTTRANKNVVDWGGWCAVDVDDHEFKGDLKNELISRYGKYTFICYSTASSKSDFPKFRMVFPTKTRIRSDNIKHFWYALNTELGSIGDKQTKDLSRMYYIPGEYAGAFNFIFSNSGDYINPEELMSKHDYVEKKASSSFLDRLPEDLQTQIIEYRKAQLDNTSITWTGYRDCPFFPRRLEAEYKTISNTGWYHKMYQIMVAVASKALQNKYPITSKEIADLCRELDAETGNWYANRTLEIEADRALEYAYKNA